LTALVEYAGPDVEGLGRDAQTPRDALQNFRRGLAQAALDLTQIGIGDTGALAQLAQRQARVPSLIANELAEVVQAGVERLRSHPAVPATCLAAISCSSASMTVCIVRRSSESS